MLIKIKNVYSTASGNKLEMSWLNELLTIKETIFSPYEKTKHKVKEYHFLQDGQFRTGLLSFIQKEADGDVDFEFIDLRPAYDAVMKTGLVPLILPDPAKREIHLREDQLTSARSLVELQRGIIELPPGAGKSEVAIAAMMALDKEERFAVFVHTDPLFDQWYERLQNRGFSIKDIGRIESTRWDLKRITVAMIPTLANRISDLETIEFLESLTGFVADECHISANPINECVLAETPNARFRWGLSATALDYGVPRNMRLIGLIGDPLQRVEIEDLIEQGALADIIYHFLPCPFEDFYLHSIHDIWEQLEGWKEYYDFFLHRNPYFRNLLQRICDFRSEDSCLIVVNRIQQGEYLREGIEGSQFIHGSTTTKKRTKVLKDFREGKFRVLISSPILDFGIDLPDLRVVVLAGGLESPIRLIQRIGRGLRRKAEDNLLHVYDFDFGLISYLGEHSESRIETMKERCPNLKISSKL